MRTLSRLVCIAAVLTVLAMPGISSPIWDYSWVSSGLFSPIAVNTNDTQYQSTPAFTQDNSVFQATFYVPTYTQVTIRTMGYGGGINVPGLIVPGGGFAPTVQVFDSNGISAIGSPLVGPGGSSCAPNSPSGDFSQCLDIFYQTFLEAGTYTVTLTQWGNQAVSDHLSDGFSQPLSTGDLAQDAINATYTSVDSSGNSGYFYDPFGTQRNGEFALDIWISPEPGTTVLTGAGLILAALGLKKRRISMRDKA